MPISSGIFDLLKEEGAEASRRARRAVILQPGAIGDCILTLPLIQFIKEQLKLGWVDMFGRTEYIGIFPGRTCVDGIRSVDSISLYKLFVGTEKFELSDGDPLIEAFSDYSWVVSFLGERESDFEKNLIFTTNCSRSAEVLTLPFNPPENCSTHISHFYIQQFARYSELSLSVPELQLNQSLIKAKESDVSAGKEILRDLGLDSSDNVVVLHPGSGREEKCWHIDNFEVIAQELGSRGYKVVFLLGPAEEERYSSTTLEKLNSIAKCAGDLQLGEVLALLSCTRIFIGNDSGITHLSAALGTRTVAVFGPTYSDIYRPIGPAVTIFKDNNSSFADKASSGSQYELLDTLVNMNPI